MKKQCGYNECFAVFDFHHKNPIDKDKRRESREYLYKDFERKVKEGKIQLLCANCHRKIHYGGDERDV